MLAADIPNWSREPKFNRETKAGAILYSVSAETSLEKIEPLAVLLPIERRRLEELRDQFKQDPKRLLRLEEAKKLRVDQLVNRLENSLSVVSDKSLSAYKATILDAEAKSEAARVAGTELFKADPLPDKIGTETWKALWTAARNFSNEVYSTSEFPNVGPTVVCVLCQQSVAPEAADRLRRFAEFVKEDTRRSADAALEEKRKARRLLENVQIGHDHAFKTMLY